METGKAIYKLLKDSADVGAICADRIYPELAQQSVDAPFIVYTIVDNNPAPTKTGTSKLDTSRVELYCVSNDYTEAMDLGIAVRTALDRVSGTVSGVQVQSINFDTSDVQYDPDQEMYVLEQLYDVRIQRTGSAVTIATVPGNAFTVTETDGTPSGSVNKLVFSNGTVTINGTTASIASGAATANNVVLTSAFNNTVSSANVYIPFNGTADATAFGAEQLFVAPFDGSLKEIHLFRHSGSNMTSGDLIVDFRRVTGSATSSSVEEETLSTPINTLTSYVLTFTGAQMQSGSVYVVYVRNGTNQPIGDVTLSMVFEVTSID